MPYEFYKILHFIGLFTVICAIGAIIYHTWAQGDSNVKARRWLMIFHGVAVLIILVSGFGLLARLGMMSGWPTWVWIKISSWIFLIITPSLALRVPKTRQFLWWMFPVVLYATAYSVVYKLQ